MDFPKAIEPQVICRGFCNTGVARTDEGEAPFAVVAVDAVSLSAGPSFRSGGYCAGDHVQPSLSVARAFSLLRFSDLPKRLLQLLGDMGLHLPIARALSPFVSLAHRPVSMASLIAGPGQSITVHA